VGAVALYSADQRKGAPSTAPRKLDYSHTGSQLTPSFSACDHVSGHSVLHTAGRVRAFPLHPNFRASLVWEDLEANEWRVADCIEDRHCLALCDDRCGVMTFDFSIAALMHPPTYSRNVQLVQSLVKQGV
jgi:hypothetical protein